MFAADVMIKAANETYWTAAEAEKINLNTVIRFWILKNCYEVLTAD